jgi:hypothetical protein
MADRLAPKTGAGQSGVAEGEATGEADGEAELDG